MSLIQTPPTKVQANHEFDRALQCQERGDHAQAAQIYQNLLQENPQRMAIWGYLAIAQFESGQAQLALDTLERALRLAPKEINLHMQRAYICKRVQQSAQAIVHYQQVLSLNPHYAKAHNNLAAEYATNDNYLLALQHYRHAVHNDPGLVPAHLNLGILLLKQGEWAAAEKQFRNVLALDSEHYSAYFYLGTLYLEMDRLDEAETALQYLLSQTPEHVDAWVNRGAIALKQKREQAAIDYFRQALILDNDHREARNNLAATFIHFDRYEQALQYYTGLLRDEPNNIEYLYNSGVAQMGLGHLSSATQLFQHVLGLESRHFGALSNLAAIQMRLGDRLEARELLQRALDVQPHDPATRFMLQALSGDTQTQGACREYVQELFNHYAVNYDAHMQGVLEYGVPQRLWHLLHQSNIRSYPKALDLGCGTGLCGMILRPLTQHLTGVDLAAKMLSVAREKAIYDTLIEAELLAFLQNNSDVYDLIIAADVLPYLDDLAELFRTIRARMALNTVFWFTTEISMDQPWALQQSMRFCHHADYIQMLCHEYQYLLVHQETVVARKQDGQDLKVNLFGIRQCNS